MVAQVGATEYATLAEAIAAVPEDGTPTTITILQNIDLGTGFVTIPATKNVVLQLGGKTITSASKSYGTIRVAGELLVSGGTVQSTQKYAIETTAAAAKVTLESGWLKTTANSNGAVYGSSGTFVMTDGEIVAAGTGVSVKTVDIQGGTITAQKAGVSGAGTISGGSITSTGSYAAYADKTGGTLTITGGTLTGLSGKGAVGIYTGNVLVTGGTLRGPPEIGYVSNATGLVLAGTTADHAGDLAVYDGETLVGYYASSSTSGLTGTNLKGRTVKLTQNLALTAPLKIATDLTLDLNGHNITVSAPAQNAINITAGSSSASRQVTLTGEGCVTCDNGGACNVVNVNQYCDVTIAGGDYRVGGEADNACVYIAKSYTARPTTVSITGGHFESGDGRYVLNINDDARETGGATMSVTGGTFKDFDPMNNIAEGEGTSFLPEGYKTVTDDDGRVVVQQKVIVATVNGVGYESLAEALAAVPADGTATTVTLVANTEENVVIAAGQNVALDLGEFTLNGKQAANTPTIKNKGALSVENGTVKRAGEGSASYYIIENEGAITLNTTVTGSASSSMIRNNAASATMTFDGGTYTQTGAFIVLKNDLGTVTVNGGTFTTQSDKNVLNNWDTMTINGGTFKGWILNGAYDTDNNVLTITGGTFDSSQIRTYTGNGKTLAPIVITGGAFTADQLKYVPENEAQVKVSGGSFMEKVPVEYCAAGFAATDESAEGTYGVAPAAAQIGEAYYLTLETAVREAVLGDRILLLADNTTDLTLPHGIVVEANGFANRATFAAADHCLLVTTADPVTWASRKLVNWMVVEAVVDSEPSTKTVVPESALHQQGEDQLMLEGESVSFVCSCTMPGYYLASVKVNGVPVAPANGLYAFTVGTESVTIVPEVRAAPVTVNGVGYPSLADALAAVPADGTPATVKLAVDLEDNLVVLPGQNVVLDLGGHTLNGKQAANTPTIKNQGTLSVVNGTVTRTGEGSSNWYIIENEGAITLNTTVTGSASSSLIRNNAASATMTIDDGTYTQTGAFVVLKNDLGTVTVNGGAFTTDPVKAVLNNWDTMTINGGTFTGQILNGAYDTDNNVLTINGGTFNSSKIRTYTGNGMTVAPIDITGGTFTDPLMVFTAEGTASSSQAQVSGGSFKEKVPEEVCAEGFEPTKAPTDGAWGVQPRPDVVKIGEKGYWSLEAAIRASKPGDVITVIEDLSIDGPVRVDGKSFVLDLNGHPVTASEATADTAGLLALQGGSAVTIRDTSASKAGILDGGACAVSLDGAQLTVLSGTLTGEMSAVEVHAGYLNVTGGNLIAAASETTTRTVQDGLGVSGAAVAVVQGADGASVELEISGGTFTGASVIYEANLAGNTEEQLRRIDIDVSDGTFKGAVYAQDCRAFISGGNFVPEPEAKYRRDDIKAEQPSLTVTTEADVVNKYDFKISLREALLYAAADGNGQISEEGGYKITFSWADIKADAAERGVEATGEFDLSARPIELDDSLYDSTTGKMKFILIDGSLDAGADNMMGEGDRVAVIKGMEMYTVATGAEVRAVVVGKDPVKEGIIRLVDRLEGEVPAAVQPTMGRAALRTASAPMALAEPQDDEEDYGEAVCEINGEAYTSVAKAVASVPANGQPVVITLLADYTGPGFVLNAGQNVVLDLAGHLYMVTETVGSSGTKTNGFQILKDSTIEVRNGRIRSNSAKILFQNYGALTLSDVDLDESGRDQMQYVCSNNCGSMTVRGTTTIKAPEGKVAFDVWYGMAKSGVYDAGVKVVFADDFTGMVSGTIEYGAAARVTAPTWTENASVEIRGDGHFDTTFAMSSDHLGAGDPEGLANIAIYGGTFENQESVPSAYQAVPLDGYYWEITDADGVTTKYRTLLEAVSAVKGDDVPVTIRQLFNQTGDGVRIGAHRNVTIDFNGKTYTLAEGTLQNLTVARNASVTLTGGALRSATSGTLVENMGALTVQDMDLDLRGTALDADFTAILETRVGETRILGGTVMAAPADKAVLAMVAQRDAEWAYEPVRVTFGEKPSAEGEAAPFTGKVIGRIDYGGPEDAVRENTWIDAARIDVYDGNFDITVNDTGYMLQNSVENIRLYGGTFTTRSTVQNRRNITSALVERPIADYAYTTVEVDWEYRARYAHFVNAAFDFRGKDVTYLFDRCWFEGCHPNRDWVVDASSAAATRVQLVNSAVYGAKGAVHVTRHATEEALADGDAGTLMLVDATIGETTGPAALQVEAPLETVLVNVTFYGNAGRVLDTVGALKAVNVLSQANGTELAPKGDDVVMTSLYRNEYTDAEIFRMDGAKPHFGPRWLRASFPVDESEKDGGWSLTPAYHILPDSAAAGNSRYIRLQVRPDGVVDAVWQCLTRTGGYSRFAGVASDCGFTQLYYDQTLCDLQRGQPSRGSFWVPVDEPSLIVTTVRDTVDPTDLEISLREAINYMKYLAAEDHTTAFTIGFDWEKIDEEQEALRAQGLVGDQPGQWAPYTMYLGKSFAWTRKTGQGDCTPTTGKLASGPIAVSGAEVPQGFTIDAQRYGSVRPYFTLDGSQWGSGKTAFDLGDDAKLRLRHFRICNLPGGTGIALGDNVNLFLSETVSVDSAQNGVLTKDGKTNTRVVLERASVANIAGTGIKATLVSGQNATVDGGQGAPGSAIVADFAQLFNATVVGGISARTVNGVNDILSGPVGTDETKTWFRFTAFDTADRAVGDTNVTHNVKADDLHLVRQFAGSQMYYYNFPNADVWGREGTVIGGGGWSNWARAGEALPVYTWGFRTSQGAVVENVPQDGNHVAQALPDTWSVQAVGQDPVAGGSSEMKGAILSDTLTNSRNPHAGQLSMGAWQTKTIVCWKTLATDELQTTDHATEFGRVDLNTYYSSLQDAVEALAQNAENSRKEGATAENNVKFEGKDAIFLVSSTLRDTALGTNCQTVVSHGSVAIVGNSYLYSGICSTQADAAIVVKDGCDVAFSNVAIVDSKQDGVRKEGAGNVTMYRTSVLGNKGNGVTFAEDATGDLLIYNSTVANNTLAGVSLNGGMAEVYDTTVAGNGTGLDGAHSNYYLANSLVLGNAKDFGSDCTVKADRYGVNSGTVLSDAAGMTADEIAAVFYGKTPKNSMWNRCVRINYTGAAGWMGTKVGRGTDGRWYYLDRGDAKTDKTPVADWKWRSTLDDSVYAGAVASIDMDERGESRLYAEQAGFHEYAVGAFAPKMQLEIEVMDQVVEYSGTSQQPDSAKAIYKITTGIGKLNQGQALYFNAADGLFYSTFTMVTNRTADAEGVAPSAWGEPTVSDPRDDLNAPTSPFRFDAMIAPVSSGDKIHVLHADVPGAKLDPTGNFCVDDDGYMYLDGYPFVVDDAVLTMNGRDITEYYDVVYPQTESGNLARLIITPKSVVLSRAFSQTKEYDGTKEVIITADSLEHAGVFFGEVNIASDSEFFYDDENVYDNYEDYLRYDESGRLIYDKKIHLTSNNLKLSGSKNAMGDYYITSETSYYVSLIIPKQVEITLSDALDLTKIYNGETTQLEFAFTEDYLTFTSVDKDKKVCNTLKDALVKPGRYIEGVLVVTQDINGEKDETGIIAKDVGKYPFVVTCKEVHVYDHEDDSLTPAERTDYARNYSFNFKDITKPIGTENPFTGCVGVYEVLPREITIPVTVNDRVYNGSNVVTPADGVDHTPFGVEGTCGEDGATVEAFVVNTLGDGNATYASAHVYREGEPQLVRISDPTLIVLEGLNGAETKNYTISYDVRGAIKRRHLDVAFIKGVQDRLYDGTTVVAVNTADPTTYGFVDGKPDAQGKVLDGLVGTETLRLAGAGYVANGAVSTGTQEVVWDNLRLLDGSGTASDYELGTLYDNRDPAEVVIDARDITLAFSAAKMYDGTLSVETLRLAASKSDLAGNKTALEVETLPSADGAPWRFLLHTDIVNEETETEELLTISVGAAHFTQRNVNIFTGNPKTILQIDALTVAGDEDCGARLGNYNLWVAGPNGDKDGLHALTSASANELTVDAAHPYVWSYKAGGEEFTATTFAGTGTITLRPITFKAKDQWMSYGGEVPRLDTDDVVALAKGSLPLAEGDTLTAVSANWYDVSKSSAGIFKKGTYPQGVKGNVTISFNGVSVNRNYTIIYEYGELQVGPKTLTMVLDDEPFVKYYDGSLSADEHYEAITLSGLVEGDDVVLTGTFAYDDINVKVRDLAEGEAEEKKYATKTVTFTRTGVSGKDAANYEWAKDGDTVIVAVSGPGKASILPRPVTVGATASDKDYDSTVAATPNGQVFTDGLTGEAFALTGEGFVLDYAKLGATFESKNAGRDKVVTFTGYSDERVSPATDATLLSNYVFTFDPNTTATIFGIPLTVTAKDQKMTYGEETPNLNTSPVADESAQWTASGLIAQDAVTVTLSYTNALETSSSGNYIAGGHENAIALAEIVVRDANGVDVTASYEITYESAVLTVAQRVLTVTVEGAGVTKVYDGTTTIADGQENHAIANNIAGDDVDVTGAFAYNTKDVATATTIIFSGLALTGADADNYTLGDVTEASDTGARITPLETTVTIAANNKTYDGNKSATAASAVFAPLVGSEQFALDLAQVTGAFDTRHAATDKPVVWNDYEDTLVTPVSGTGAIMSNYAFVHALTATATVEPKPATISFAAKSKTYDATTDAARTDDPFVFAGLVTQNEANFAEAFTLDDASMTYAFSDKNVGEQKTVTANGYDVAFVKSSSEGGVSEPGDYVFTFANTAKASIVRKPITITYTTENKVYDANTVAARAAFDYGALIDGDALTLNDASMTYAFDTKDVGEGKEVTATGYDEKLLVGADVPNYEVTFDVKSTAAVTRRPVTVAFELVEKTYDGTVDYLEGDEPKLLVPVVTNMAVDESLDVNATGAFVDSIHNEIVTDYFQVEAFGFAIAAGGDLGNYTVTWAKDRVLEQDAGTTAFTMTDEGAFRTDGRINRRPITITANDQTMTYGEENPELNTAVYGGDGCDWAITTGEKVAWETVTVNLKYGTIKTSTSGCYTATEGGAPHANAIVKASVVVENVVAEGESPNVTDSYAITFVNGKLAVAKREIELTVDGTKFEKVYDGNRTTEAKDRNYTFCDYEKGEGCGPVAGDLLDATGTYTYNDKDVRDADTVTFSGITLTKADASNYKLKATEVVSSEGAKITPRETVITVTPTSREYDGTTVTTAKVEAFSDLVTNEDGVKESFVLEKTTLSATFAQTDVGTGIAVTYGNYTDDLVTPGPGTSKDNYSFRFTASATGDIWQRPSTITWAANDKVYDAKVAATVTPGSFAFSNLVTGEGFAMDEAGFDYTFDNKNVGTGKTVTATPKGTLESHISVADGAAAATKASNYTFTLTTTAKAAITPASLTISYTVEDKIYDATAKATRDAFTYAPLLVDDHGVTDDVTLDDSAMEYEFITVGDVAGKDAAENKTVKTVEGKGYDKSYLRGVDKDNYDVTFTDASTATINKMDLRLVLPKADKVYDATTALREGTLVTTLQGAGDETFTATAAGAYKDTHANDYDTYVTVNDLTIAGANGAVFGNYVIKYAGHGGEAIREQTETGTYENATFRTTDAFGTPGRITTLDFTVAAINQTMTYGDSYPTINGVGEHWGERDVWSLPGTPLATGDRIWVTLKWNESIPTSSAGYYTAGTHEGALVVDAIVIKRTDGTDVTKSYQPTFQSATLTIKPRLLTVTVDGTNFSKVYDGNRTTESEDRAYTVDDVVADEGTGKFAADAVTVEGTYLYNDKDVKDASYVIFSEQKLTGTDAANYTLNGVTSVVSSEGAKITRRASEITVTTTGKTYDGNVTANPITGFDFSNLVLENESGVKEAFTLKIADFAGTFNSKDVTTATTVTYTYADELKKHVEGANATSLLTNYDFTFVPTAAATIATRPTTVTFRANDKDYDQTTAATPVSGSFAFSNLVDGESFSVTDENAALLTYAFSDKNVGKDKTVTASGFTTDRVTEGANTLKTNYDFTFTPTATAEIRPITLTISYTANDKVYDATTNATRAAFAYTGLKDGDVFTLNDASMYYGFDTKNVGVDKTVTAYGFDPAFLQGADVQNYTVAFTTNALAKVTKKSLTLTLSEAVKTYDGTTDYTSSIGQTIPGTEGGEVFTATGTGVFNSKLVGSSETYFHVTNLEIVGTAGADFGNYTITYNGVTIDVTALETTKQTITEPFDTTGTITQKEITVSADAKTVVYGEAYPVLTFTGETGVDGDTLTVPLAYDETKIKQSTSNHYKAGVWAEAIHLSSDITISDGAQDVKGCYAITFNPAALTVTQRDLSMTLKGSDFTKEYDGNTSAKQTTHTLVNNIAGDKVDIAGTYTYSSKDVTPVKTVTANALSITGDDAANYQLTATSYTSTEGAVITVRPITVSAQANDKVYDQTTAATSQTVTFDGLVAGETLGYPTTLNGAFASASVGTHAVTWTDFDWAKVTADEVKANYVPTLLGSSATIKVKKLTVRAQPQTMVYAEKRPDLAAGDDDWTVDGLIEGDKIHIVLDWNEANIPKRENGHELVGKHEEAVSLVSASGANYEIDFVSAPLTVTEDEFKNLYIGWANKHLPITVATAWLDRNVPAFAHWAETDGPERTSDGLRDAGMNGYEKWQSYLLALDPQEPTAKIWIDADQDRQVDRMRVKYRLAEGRPETDYALHFRLDTTLKGATVATSSAYQEKAEFDIALSGADPTGLYTIQCVFTSNTVSSAEVKATDLLLGGGVKTVNTFGLLKVSAETKTTAIAVPWTALSPSADAPVSVAKLVKTATLDAGDALLVYKPAEATYEGWRLDEAGELQPMLTCAGVTVVPAPSAAVRTVSCGGGAMLVRTHPERPFYLFGQLPAEPAVSEVLPADDRLSPTYQLIASPGWDDLDLATLQATTGAIAATPKATELYDQIFVPQDTGEPVMYTYQNGKWGYDKRTETDVGGRKIIRTERETSLPKIKAGTGFWYVSRGGNPTFAWPQVKEVR